MRDLSGFEQAVTDLRALPARLARPAAIGTVIAESLVVLGMLVGSVGLPAGFVLGAVLLLLFSVVLVAALRRDAGVSCNCFGASERPISWYDLGRNAALLACCGAGLAGYAIAEGNPPGSVIALLGLMAGCFFLIVTNSEDIVESLRKPYVLE